MLAALLTLLTATAATAAPVPAAPPPAPLSPTATSPSLTPITPLTTATTAVADTVVDAVLPCGLRVLTARDLSLPVAAVVLALEVGSEDDPAELPGLVHALAYQLEQGNRELRPAEAIATAQDAGGIYSLATGLAQVRFESLIPASRLDPMLWVESQRLRTPTTAPQRWAQSLGWAAGDERGGSRLRPEALAFVHGAPGLGHDGRAVSKTPRRRARGRARGRAGREVQLRPRDPGRRRPGAAGAAAGAGLADVRRSAPEPAQDARAAHRPPGGAAGDGRGCDHRGDHRRG
jgi:hypothetical protein